MPTACNIIMPVKDSLPTAERAIRAIISSGHTLTVYNDYSTQETTKQLTALSTQLGFQLVNIAEYTDHSSPNYLFTLIHAQNTALKQNEHLLIVESDVIIGNHTIDRLVSAASYNENCGMAAAITTNEQGDVNFPYLYAKKYKNGTIETKKRLSFCCTLITNNFLHTYSFSQLNPDKNWYDVFISHKSIELGFHNYLLTDTPVLHLPHSSRPWKQLKYTNPLLYYWRKITRQLDRI